MAWKLVCKTCCVVAALWAVPNAATAAGIATVVDVVNEGYRQPPGASETEAKAADELVQQEALRTESDSVIQVRFVDGSELSVEQSSEVVLSDYVFDGSTTAGVIDLNDGLFHFTSNGTSDQGLKLRTPVATIGIRGTEFLVHVDSDDATIIDILEGSVEATPRGAGKSVMCVGGQSILIASEDEDAQCGDIGAFATAAAPPASSDFDRGQRGADKGGGSSAAHKGSEPPSGGSDPGSGPGPGNGTSGCGLNC